MDNILVFIDWYLPGTNAGGPVRSVANTVDHLGGEFHFSIITRDTDYCSSDPYPGITPDTWIPRGESCRVCYLSGKNVTRKILSRLIRQTPFDVAWINGIYSWKFSILPLFLLRGSGKRTVVSPRGMLNPQAFTSGQLKKRLFIALARLTGVYRGIVFHATNEDEKQHILKQLGQKTKVLVAPNLAKMNASTSLSTGSEERKVKNEEWSTGNHKSQITNHKSQISNTEYPPAVTDYFKTPGSLRLVSIARISPEKGTLHALRFLKEVKGGEVQFDLYGPVYNEDYWQECLKVISGMPENVKVQYHGPVDGERVGEALLPAHFLLMTTEGENFGHSILEALTAGRPVIISDRTPWKDLAARKAGFDLPLEEPASFVRALEQALAMDNHTYQQWSQGASLLAAKYSGNQANVEACRKLFKVKSEE